MQTTANNDVFLVHRKSNYESLSFLATNNFRLFRYLEKTQILAVLNGINSSKITDTITANSFYAN